MLYTITNTGSTNARPSSIGANTIPVAFEGEVVFTVANFTTETTPPYEDPEGDALSYIKVMTLPSKGELQVDGVAIIAGTIVSAGVISAGNFKYVAAIPGTSFVKNPYSFVFDCADIGSNTLSALVGGVITFDSQPEINLAPDVIGDNTVFGTYGVTTVFTAADFTTNTTPPYNDPEGDIPYKVKILSLPSDGTLSFNGLSVAINQEILLSSVDSGYLTFTQNPAAKGSQILEFDFAVSDLGSKEFTS